ncbi:MAG: 4-hydroxy-tetrahydrodipicolinate reductase [Gammaproteobacteria bacterium]
MTRLAIVGSAGRMGGALLREASEDNGLEVGVALERANASSLGQDAGVVAGLGKSRLKISSDAQADDFDVMVDFSTPEATMQNIQTCLAMQKAIVVGTTGMSQEQVQSLHSAAKEIPVFYAANMSVGVNVTLKLLEVAAKALGEQTDIEVIEAHHKHKVDAPSGTALKMGEVLAASLGKSLERDGVFTRHGITGARKEGSIGFSTIRGGDIAGEHTVMFIGEAERIEITHRATDRKIFAQGALRAAKWVVNQPAGLYGMNELLGFD